METRTFQSRQSSIDAGDAPRVLLSGLIDYAGLFPPASLGMPDAVALLEATLKEEKATDAALTTLAKSVVNVEAEAAL